MNEVKNRKEKARRMLELKNRGIREGGVKSEG